jgi:hypothetical protein
VNKRLTNLAELVGFGESFRATFFHINGLSLLIYCQNSDVVLNRTKDKLFTQKGQESAVWMVQSALNRSDPPVVAPSIVGYLMIGTLAPDQLSPGSLASLNPDLSHPLVADLPSFGVCGTDQVVNAPFPVEDVTTVGLPIRSSVSGHFSFQNIDCRRAADKEG